MISLIVKSYLAILLSVAAGALLLIMGGIFVIFRLFSPRSVVHKAVQAPKNDVRVDPSATQPRLVALDSSQHELSAIAGDDLVATQLDLARAYLEIENHTAAAKLLEMVCDQGSQAQQEEAMHLITHISDLQFVERVRKKSRK